MCQALEEAYHCSSQGSGGLLYDSFHGVEEARNVDDGEPEREDDITAIGKCICFENSKAEGIFPRFLRKEAICASNDGFGILELCQARVYEYVVD